MIKSIHQMPWNLYKNEKSCFWALLTHGPWDFSWIMSFFIFTLSGNRFICNHLMMGKRSSTCIIFVYRAWETCKSRIECIIQALLYVGITKVVMSLKYKGLCHTYITTYTHTNTSCVLHMHARVCVVEYIYMYKYIYANSNIFVYISVCMCLYVCMNVHVLMHIYLFL